MNANLNNITHKDIDDKISQREKISIKDVEQFWNNQPLFVGESAYKEGTREFFEHHNQVYIEDCFAGDIDSRIFKIDKDLSVLDLGCGIGFWVVEFYKRGFHNIVGADLSENSLKIAKKRLNLYSSTLPNNVLFKKENAENLSFSTEIFDHVNCQGVVHHTPNPKKAILEIHRVLKKDGTALISVYYKNSILKNWSLFQPIAQLLKPGLSGRNREHIYKKNSIDEIVRMYDGAQNPLGLAFSHKEFIELLEPFKVCDIWYDFFPARSLKFKIPRFLHKFLSRTIPFMIFAKVKK